MISKQIDIEDWIYKQYRPLVATLQIKSKYGILIIVNVYNPQGEGPRLKI